MRYLYFFIMKYYSVVLSTNSLELTIPEHKKTPCASHRTNCHNSRGGGIRTPGPMVPNHVLYQTEPHPVANMVEGEGFEPSKAEPTDLQSVPFGRSGTPPQSKKNGSPNWTRTSDIMINSHALYRLSY